MAASSVHGITVAITGGVGRLGPATATTFLEAGANVAIYDVNQNCLSQTEQDCKPYQECSLIARSDVADETEVQAFVDIVIAKFGRLDMVINNAGILDKFDPVGSTTKECWDKVIGNQLDRAIPCHQDRGQRN